MNNEQGTVEENDGTEQGRIRFYREWENWDKMFGGATIIGDLRFFGAMDGENKVYKNHEQIYEFIEDIIKHKWYKLAEAMVKDNHHQEIWLKAVQEKDFPLIDVVLAHHPTITQERTILPDVSVLEHCVKQGIIFAWPVLVSNSKAITDMTDFKRYVDILFETHPEATKEDMDSATGFIQRGTAEQLAYFKEKCAAKQAGK